MAKAKPPTTKRKPAATRKPKRKPTATRKRTATKARKRPPKIAGDPPRDLNGYDPVATAGGCTFDRAAAERVIRFVESLCVHIEGPMAGRPLVLEPWQRDVYLTLFGWRRPDGTRRYRKAFVTMARKNSKTTSFDAPIALYMTGYDGEHRAQNYAISGKKAQAGICWGIAAEMVKQSRALASVFESVDSQKRIIHYATGSFFAALPADADGAHGMNPFLVINDETHVTPPKLIEALETGFGARKNQLELFTTTAGTDKDSDWWRLLEYSRKVVAGSQATAANRRKSAKFIDDPFFLPVLYETPADDVLAARGLTWTDRAAWALANPNLDVSISGEQVAADCREAEHNLVKEAGFRRLRLNQFVERQQKPIKAAQWEACYVPPADWPNLVGRDCWAGLDLSSSRDLTAKVLVFPIDGRWWVKVRAYWPPQSARDGEKEIKAPLASWLDDGHLVGSPGQPYYTDYSLVRADLRADHETYKLRECGFDPYNATDLANDLDGFGIKMTEVRQTTLGLNEATKRFIKMVGECELAHDGHPVAAWCVDNLEVIYDRAGNIRPVKPLLPGSERAEDRSKKIDVAVALITAFARALVPEPTNDSIYNEREMFVI